MIQPQADPLGLVEGASVYGYVTQNPGRYVDVRGENPGAVIVGGGIAIGKGLQVLNKINKARKAAAAARAVAAAAAASSGQQC